LILTCTSCKSRFTNDHTLRTKVPLGTLTYTQTQPTSRVPQTPRVSMSVTPVQRISSTRLPAGVRQQGSGFSHSSNYGSRASTESPHQRPTAYTQNLPPRSPPSRSSRRHPNLPPPSQICTSTRPKLLLKKPRLPVPQQGVRMLSFQFRSRIFTTRRACSCQWPRWLLPCSRNLCQSHWCKRCLSPSSSHSYPQSCCRSPWCPLTPLLTQSSPVHRTSCPSHASCI
jgi:hypothetical protein